MCFHQFISSFDQYLQLIQHFEEFLLVQLYGIIKMYSFCHQVETENSQDNCGFFDEISKVNIRKDSSLLIFPSQVQFQSFQEVFKSVSQAEQISQKLNNLILNTNTVLQNQNNFLDQLLEPKLNGIQNKSIENSKNIEISQSSNNKLLSRKDQDSLESHDETKNVPKNYIKAIFAFIIDHPSQYDQLFNGSEQLQNFLKFAKQERKIKRYTIGRFKDLWTHKDFGKIMRKISCHFFRKRSLPYIYSSKIQKKSIQVKYRQKLIDSIECPEEFTQIK